jgi:Tfp pilus assembly protein PilN
MSAPNQLSFLPDDYLQRKAQRRANTICATLFLLAAAGIGSSYMLAERSLDSVEKRAEEVNREYADAAKKIKQVQQMQERQRTMARQAELTAQLLEKVPRSYVLAEVTNALPAGVSLLDLTLDSKVRRPVAAAVPTGKTAAEARKAAREAKNAPPQPEVKQYDVSIKLTGIAFTDVQVARFITSLNQSPLLQDVNLQISDTLESKSGGETMRKFVIETSLRPDAQVATMVRRTEDVKPLAEAPAATPAAPSATAALPGDER